MLRYIKEKTKLRRGRPFGSCTRKDSIEVKGFLHLPGLTPRELTQAIGFPKEKATIFYGAKMSTQCRNRIEIYMRNGGIEALKLLNKARKAHDRASDAVKKLKEKKG
jgi:hypothetical protein